MPQTDKSSAPANGACIGMYGKTPIRNPGYPRQIGRDMADAGNEIPAKQQPISVFTEQQLRDSQSPAGNEKLGPVFFQKRVSQPNAEQITDGDSTRRSEKR